MRRTVDSPRLAASLVDPGHSHVIRGALLLLGGALAFAFGVAWAEYWTPLEDGANIGAGALALAGILGFAGGLALMAIGVYENRRSQRRSACR